MTARRLRLNPTKTQVMWLGFGQQLKPVDKDKANSAFHPSGVGNEYLQLRLGRQRQVVHSVSG